MKQNKTTGGNLTLWMENVLNNAVKKNTGMSKQTKNQQQTVTAFAINKKIKIGL